MVRTERRAAPARMARPAARPAEAPRSNWTGGQAGGQGGGSNGAQSFVDPPFICRVGFACPVSPFSFSGSPSSFTGGVFLGYRWQAGGTVVGVEADVSAKKLETTHSQLTGPTDLGFGAIRHETFTGSVKQTWDASFRARAGLLVTPWTLAYLTGGLAIGEVHGSFVYRGTLVGGDVVCVGPCTASVTSEWSDIRTGGTVGAGLEHALGTFIKARIEYRYTDFGRYSRSVPVNTNCTGFAGNCFAPTSSNVDIRAAFHKVTAGIGFDF